MPTDPFVADRLDDEPRQAPEPVAGRDDAAGAQLAGRPSRRPRRRRAAARRAARLARAEHRVRAAPRRTGSPRPFDSVAARARRRRRRRRRGAGDEAGGARSDAPRSAADVECAALVLGYLGVADPDVRRAARRRGRRRAPRLRSASRTICDCRPARGARASRPSALDARASPTCRRRCSSRPDLAPRRCRASSSRPSTRSSARRCVGSPTRRSRRTRPRPTPRGSTRGRRSRPTATPGSSGCPTPRSTAVTAATCVAYAMLVEEVARACGSSSLFVLISRLACEPILLFGSDELKQRVVPQVASGEWQGSYCLSESHAGSDVASMTHPRGPRRRPLRAHRLEVVDHERRRLRASTRCSPRPIPTPATAASARSWWRRDRPGFSVAQARVEDGHAGLAHRRDRARRGARPGREPHRRGAPRVRLRDGRARRVPARRSVPRRVGIAQGALDAAARVRAPSASSSTSAWPSSRACSSCSPTWRRGSRPPACSCTARAPGSTPARRARARRRPWPSCSRATPRCR